MEERGRRTGNVFTAILVIIILCIIGFLIWWFGFRSPNNNTNTGQNQAAAKAQIKSNWTAFFSGQTSADQRVKLLQNGQEFNQVIQADSQSPTAKATSATVSNVALNGNNSATVTYTVSINKQPALSNQKGQAVLTNGVWKVSDAAFCGLLKLSGTLPPMCPGGSSSGAASQSQQTPSQPGTQTTPSQ